MGIQSTRRARSAARLIDLLAEGGMEAAAKTVGPPSWVAIRHHLLRILLRRKLVGHPAQEIDAYASELVQRASAHGIRIQAQDVEQQIRAALEESSPGRRSIRARSIHSTDAILGDLVPKEKERAELIAAVQRRDELIRKGRTSRVIHKVCRGASHPSAAPQYVASRTTTSIGRYVHSFLLAESTWIRTARFPDSERQRVLLDQIFHSFVVHRFKQSPSLSEVSGLVALTLRRFTNVPYPAGEVIEGVILSELDGSRPRFAVDPNVEVLTKLTIIGGIVDQMGLYSTEVEDLICQGEAQPPFETHITMPPAG